MTTTRIAARFSMGEIVTAERRARVDPMKLLALIDRVKTAAETGPSATTLAAVSLDAPAAPQPSAKAG